MQQTVKRSFDVSSLPGSTFEVFKLLPWIIWAYVPGGFSGAFCERILLVVSGVNACVYCSWFHSHIALRSGVTPAEVELLLNQLVPQGVEEEETSALLFALHYAQSGGNPLEEEVKWLNKDFSYHRAKAIQGLCAGIHFGNLCGNTFDAFIARLRGKPVTHSSIWIELPVFLLCLPFLLPVLPRVKSTAYPQG